MSDTLRIFIALEPESSIQQQALEEFRSLGLGQGLKILDSELMHLTLKFWAHFPLQDLANLLQVLKEVAARNRPVTLNFNQPLVLGGQNARVLSLLGCDDGSLADLHYDLEETLVEAGIADREGRVFKPHLTLARVKSFLPPADVQRFEQWKPDLVATCDELKLFSSTLTPAGPEYDQMAAFSLTEHE